jgi:hypothetical protein
MAENNKNADSTAAYKRPTVDSLMRNSFLFGTYNKYEKEIYSQYPDLADHEMLDWIEFGSILGALLIFTQPESIFGKAISRKLVSTTIGRKILALCAKVGPNRYVVKQAGAKIETESVAKLTSQTLVKNAWKENAAYIATGLLSDASDFSDFIDLSYRTVKPPSYLDRKVFQPEDKDPLKMKLLEDYLLSLFSEKALSHTRMYCPPGEGLSITISREDLYKAVWMASSFERYYAKTPDMCNRWTLQKLALIGIIDKVLDQADIDVVNITRFNETETSCFGGLTKDAYESLSLIPQLAAEFNKRANSVPWAETRNAMLVSYISTVLWKGGRTKIRLVASPLMKTLDYIDLSLPFNFMEAK